MNQTPKTCPVDLGVLHSCILKFDNNQMYQLWCKKNLGWHQKLWKHPQKQTSVWHDLAEDVLGGGDEVPSRNDMHVSLNH